MMRALALSALLGLSPGEFFGADKLRHFLVSGFVHSVTWSAATAAGADHRTAQISAAAATMAIGVWKERQDREAGGRFSVGDLAWDAAGALAAASIMNGARPRSNDAAATTGAAAHSAPFAYISGR